MKHGRVRRWGFSGRYSFLDARRRYGSAWIYVHLGPFSADVGCQPDVGDPECLWGWFSLNFGRASWRMTIDSRRPR